MFPSLIGSFIAGGTLVFFAWIMPSFVSHGMFAPAAFFISTVFGFIGAICAWHRDLILERGLKQSPEPAEVILADCKRNGRPYAVYLRSFNYERLQNPLPIPLIRSGGSARQVELRLVKMLHGRLPILALSDPAYPFSMSGAHRFGPPVKPWPMFLEEPLRGSSLIILYVAEANPGLMFEINLIRESGLMGKTLVITNSFGFKSFLDFKWVTNEEAPHLENTLAEIFESFNNTRLESPSDEMKLPIRPSGVSKVSHGHGWQRLNQSVGAKPILKIAGQVFMFLLPLVMAWKAWGVPDILLHEYWLYDKPMPEIRKMQDDIRRINDSFRRSQSSRSPTHRMLTAPNNGMHPTADTTALM